MDMDKQENLLPYPAIGTQLPTSNASLRKLRSSASIYVDKTDMVLDLALHYNKVFLSRPRRFGKTLLVSTFEELFQRGLESFGGFRRLYRNGECIEAPFKIIGRWKQPAYTVVRLDFSFLKDYGDDELERIFKIRTIRAFRKIGFRPSSESEEDWLGELQDWLLSLAPYSVVLLVDEYDAGLGCRLNDKASFSHVLSILSAFFTMIKVADEVWRFAFITGVARFGKSSIFSSMNDLEDITFMPQFGTLLGYTEQEIQENFAPYLEKAASDTKTDVASLLEGMRRHYDGFCFDETISTHVYAPWSVLKFLRTPLLGYKNHWADSGGQSSMLLTYMKSGRSDFLSLKKPCSMPMGRLTNSTDFEHISDELILVQAGYLTLARVSGPTAFLDFPNIEVCSTFNEINLLHAFGETPLPDFNAYDSTHALLTGDCNEWLKLLNGLLLSVPYDGGYPITSEAILRTVVYAHVSKKGIYCQSEVHGSHGRSDLEITAGKFHWVVELKYVRDKTDVGEESPNAKKLCDDALKAAVQQIQDKKYGLGILNRTLIRIAFVFSEFRRQIVGWETVPDGKASLQ